MRMLKPSPGECADRETILQLKMEHADTGEVRTAVSQDRNIQEGQQTVGAVNRTVMRGASKVDIQPFMWEHEGLQKYLEENWFPQFPTVGDAYDLLFDQLKEVNGKLWNLEDEARVLRQATKNQATVYRAGTVLFEITSLNDERAELVKQINALFDLNVVEKMYA